MIRRILTFITIGLAAASLHAATLTIEGPAERLPVAAHGRTGTVTVLVSGIGISNIAAYEAHLAVTDHLGRDASALFSLTSASPSAAWQEMAGASGTFDKVFDDGIGSMLLPAGATAADAAELAEITFEYHAGVVGTFTFELLPGSRLFDSDASFAATIQALEPCTVVVGEPGDVDGDGSVNVMDLLAVRSELGREGTAITISASDVNVDGVCNVMDLLGVRSNLGSGSGGQ